MTTVPSCTGTVPGTGSPGLLSRDSLDTSTACLGAVLLVDGGLLVPITAGTARAGVNVATRTTRSVGMRDGSCLCQVVVGARDTLVGWLAVPGEETPALTPAWGLPRIARSPGKAAVLGGCPCSPLVLAGTSALAVTCGTRLPVGRDKAATAGSAPPWPQLAGTCPQPAACQPYLSRSCPRRGWSCGWERGALARRLQRWGMPDTCPAPEAAEHWCCRLQWRCCPALLGLAQGQGAAPLSPQLVLAAEQVGEGTIRKNNQPRVPITPIPPSCCRRKVPPALGAGTPHPSTHSWTNAKSKTGTFPMGKSPDLTRNTPPPSSPAAVKGPC